ncbi:geranyl transferase [Enterococcus sp. JM4C]|uniref:polyprenyl synthetase family protein n=1 Tax=Candidatus Enterococcus huntleyi TaxID=1857217 RepID=UPI00137998BF|nr:farnesyl diphosphate synthase [Enterococcus sp. JM4C]KAF1297141.1 geranyl transferase [Enterococcus sp. JM4C]
MAENQTFAEQHLPYVEEELVSFIEKHTTNEELKKSMLYSVNAGGKRIRPQLLLAVVASFHKTVGAGAYQTAAALEMVHTYSLIHDDLPAMDDDDLRRGKATNHKVFGEATAILAGDSLLTMAFQLVSMAQIESEPKLLLIQQFAQAAGGAGMVSGQAADMQAENKTITVEELAKIHEDKTGKLIEFALVAGGVLANQPVEVLEELRQLAGHLGLAFQIRDDLLDVTSTTEQLGKNTQRDAELNKSTYPGLLGLAEAKLALDEELVAAERTIDRIQQTVASFEARYLKELVKAFYLERGTK